jgi:hypothetical protein
VLCFDVIPIFNFQYENFHVMDDCNFSDIILTGTAKGYVNVYLLWSHHGEEENKNDNGSCQGSPIIDIKKNSNFNASSQNQTNMSSCFCSVQ